MITENIRLLLLTLLRDEVTVASWGISNIKISETQLSFSVCGFKYQGEVIIIVNEKTNYEIILDNETLGCFSLDNVVNIIDERVENSESCYNIFLNQLINL